MIISKWASVLSYKGGNFTMTGSLHEKYGTYYAVLSYKDKTKKNKNKWIPTGYEVKGNKNKSSSYSRLTCFIVSVSPPLSGWCFMASSRYCFFNSSSVRGLLKYFMIFPSLSNLIKIKNYLLIVLNLCGCWLMISQHIKNAVSRSLEGGDFQKISA